MDTQRCKGTKDLSPEEMAKFRLIEGVFRESCLKWGYGEVRTPTLEYLHLFTSTGTLTPSRLRRVYSFLDWDGWSGERVVLRPDGTIPVTRLYIDTMAGKDIARLFYVTNVFVFEETGRESRERWQCGAELIGTGTGNADLELVMLALEVLRKLGLEGIQLKLSHAGLIRALLVKLGLNAEEQTKVFDQILDGDTGVLERLAPGRPDLGQALTPLLNMKGKSPGFLRNMKALFDRDLPELSQSFDNFTDVVELVEALGCPFEVDIASGRGFEYYTGVVFQLYACDEHVGAGGRYDALIPLMGGGDVPASGFALYLDRLMGLVKPEAVSRPFAQSAVVSIGSLGVETAKLAFGLVERLHENGRAARVRLGDQTPPDAKWDIRVQDKSPRFIVTNLTTRRKSEMETEAEVLEFLRR